jgi:hypothetical protein
MEKSFPAKANLLTRYRKYEHDGAEHIENQSRLRKDRADAGEPGVESRP